MRPLEIYVHIPFCRQKCLYCDFLSAPAENAVTERYVEALCRQIALEAPLYTAFCVETVFIGGGTPSLLNAEQTARILSVIHDAFQLNRDAEITMECNPGTLDDEKLRALYTLGINRLSLGLQSVDDRELKALGRIHTCKDFEENYLAARACGFSNINVDLMSALPGQTTAGWLKTLERVTALSPEHISAYSLMIEEGTPFYDWYGQEAEHCPSVRLPQNRPPLPSEEEERRMYEQTEKFLRKKGYRRYEISNYAKPGYECRHNTGYWERTEYVGFGLGAASLIANRRFKATDRLEEYLDCFLRKGAVCDRPEALCREEITALTVEEQMEEFMFLGLRLTEGVSCKEFYRQFGADISAVYGETPEKLEKQGLLMFGGGGDKIKLTPSGVDVSNYVLARFLL